MEMNFYIKLTFAVYRVTELFPKGEPLRFQIRELANKILVDSINQGEKCSRPIQDLKNLFDLAERQNWVDSRNFLVLHREYDKIYELIDTGKTVEKSFPKQTIYKKPFKNRKEKILDILKDKKKIQLKELIQTFPQVNRRTLIRDLEELYRAGTVIRVGNGPGSCYNIKL